MNIKVDDIVTRLTVTYVQNEEFNVCEKVIELPLRVVGIADDKERTVSFNNIEFTCPYDLITSRIKPSHNHLKFKDCTHSYVSFVFNKRSVSSRVAHIRKRGLTDIAKSKGLLEKRLVGVNNFLMENAE